MANTLKDYTRITVETDTDEPITIATITADAVDMAEGYRVRLKPKYEDR